MIPSREISGNQPTRISSGASAEEVWASKSGPPISTTFGPEMAFFAPCARADGCECDVAAPATRVCALFVRVLKIWGPSARGKGVRQAVSSDVSKSIPKVILEIGT